jgi:hypothetical protein
MSLRNLLPILDGHHVLDCRTRAGDCRRHGGAQRVQSLRLSGAGSLERDIGLPDIQRPFVWSNAKVRDHALAASKPSANPASNAKFAFDAKGAFVVSELNEPIKSI